LKNRRGEDNEVFRRVWKAVETKAGETRIAKAKKRSKMMDIKKVAKE